MIQLKLSFRNLMRNLRRTLLILSILIFGMTGILTYAGYTDFSMWGLKESTIQNGLGHIQVFKKGYNSRAGESYLQYLIQDSKPVFKQLMRLDGVKEATSLLSLRGLLSNGTATETTLTNGYDLRWIDTIKNSYQIQKGQFFKQGEMYSIALGELLAEKLNAKVGDTLTLMTTTKDGAINACDITVTAVIKTGIKEYDEILSVVPIELTQELLDVKSVERFIVMLEQTDDTDKVKTAIENINTTRGLDIEIKTWFDLAVFYKKVKAMYESNITITEIIILFIVALSIITTMRMIIFERMREIGTIRALGMTRKRIISMFVYEGFWLGILGIITGIIFSKIVAFIINNSGGIYIPPPPTSTEGYYTMIAPQPLRYLEAGLIIFVSVILGSLIPAFRAAQTKIDEALRFV